MMDAPAAGGGQTSSSQVGASQDDANQGSTTQSNSPSNTALGLTSNDRVRRRPEFERAYNTGARIHGRFMTVFVVPNGGSRCRLGVAATRKLGSAVERNRAKRLAREIFRRHKPAAAIDVVIVPRREMLDAPFTSLETDYRAALERRDRGRPQPHPRRGGERRDRRPARV
jgi:ribonuclease P protein component